MESISAEKPKRKKILKFKLEKTVSQSPRKIQMGVGFKPDEKILISYFSGLPLSVDHIDYSSSRFLIITNYRVMISSTPDFDIIDVIGIKLADIIGVKIMTINQVDWLYVHSKEGNSIRFTFCRPQTTDIEVEYYYSRRFEINLGNIKSIIREAVKDQKRNPPISMMKKKPISHELKYTVWRRDNFTCQYCDRSNKEVDLTIAHIKPIRDGGDSVLDNLQTLCIECKWTNIDK